MKPETKNLVVEPLFRDILKRWVIAVCGLFIIAPTDIPLFNRFLGTIMILAFFFTIYFKDSAKLAKNENLRRLTPIPSGTKILLVIFQLSLTNFAVTFYTGTNLLSGLLGAISGQNTYQAYQDFFRESDIAVSGVFSRIQFILALAIGKLIFVFIVADFFSNTAKKTILSLSILVSSILIYASFGFARGTFFEVFEITVAIGYFFSICRSRKTIKSANVGVNLLKLVSFIGLPYFFIKNTMRRYDDKLDYFEHLCSSNFCFETYGINLTLEYFTYIFATYFSNGPYALSVYFYNLLTIKSTEYLIPLWGYIMSDYQEPGVRGLLCERYVDCSFVWMPDILIFLSLFGIFAFFFSNIFVQWAITLEQRLMSKRTHAAFVTNYFILIFLLSLPVGSFLTVSSSNMLGLFISVLMIVLPTNSRTLR